MTNAKRTTLISTESFAAGYGGPAYSVACIAKKLQDSGESIFINTSDGTLPNWGSKDIVAQSFKQKKFNIVRIFGLWTWRSVGDFVRAWFMGAKIVVSPLGMLEPWAMSDKGLKKRLAWFLYQKYLLQKADVIHATSLQEYANCRLLGLKTPVAIIPHGVDIPANLALDQRKRKGLFISRLVAKKGVELLLEAISKVRPSGWTFDIVGDGDKAYILKLQNMIIKLGIDATVKILPPAYGPEKDKHFSEASLLLLPSYSENFGIVVAEALARKIPVITTTGTPWSQLPDFECGWIVEPSLPSMSAALIEATNCDSKELGLMGERGHQLISRHFSWTTAAQKHTELSSWLMKDGVKPDFVNIN